MKNIIFACLIGVATAGTMATTIAPASAAPLNGKYCMSNGYDPICMSPKMFKMRMAMMQMTKAKVMQNRSKYCRNATYNDPICTKQMMRDTRGF